MSEQTDPRYPYPMFGIECGKGWKDLYEPLIELCKSQDITILQIKEKFGGLRFYVAAAPEWVQKLINLAESESYRTCEQCGVINGRYDFETKRYAKVHRNVHGWIQTLCSECRHAKED